jgi:hypothetical protein
MRLKGAGMSKRWGNFLNFLGLSGILDDAEEDEEEEEQRRRRKQQEEDQDYPDNGDENDYYDDSYDQPGEDYPPDDQFDDEP